jgi:hypothetical protein
MTRQMHFSGKSIARAFWLSSIIALAGCSHQAVKVRPTMIQPISNNAQFDDVVALLVDGNVDAARKMLAAMAKRDPADQQTAAMIASLDADPQVALGTRSFAYRVLPGDRMTALSQRFLGDRLKFYLLSRYNKIAVPGKIVAGQTLRIPGIAPPVVAAPHIAPQPARAPVASAEPKPVTKPPVAAPVTTAAAVRRAAQLRGAGLAALNAGNIGRSVTLLRQAAALDHNSPVIRTDLARALRIQATVAARR